MKLVVLYGPPGVGKLTVAKELARLTGYKLWDNHKSIEAVIDVFPYGTPEFFQLTGLIRFAVLAEAARADLDVIFTFVHVEGDPHADDIFDVVEPYGAQILPVQITCQKAIHEERVVLPSRSRKLNTVDGLRSYLAMKNSLLLVPRYESLRIDNTDLTPMQVAERIIEHYGLQPTG